MRAYRGTLGVLGIAGALAVVGCTGATAGRSTVPDVHRASAAACSAALAEAGVPLSIYDGGSVGPTALDSGIITCTTDSDCPPCQNGQLDRCHSDDGPQAGVGCLCDQCNTDQDCGPHAVCVCNQRGWSSKAYENQCVASQCQVDADCGPGGFCSPSPGLCGAIAAYYCHRSNDTCLSNADCPQLSCIYSAATAGWGCGSIVCGR